jgi:hypothetical protein
MPIDNGAGFGIKNAAIIIFCSNSSPTVGSLKHNEDELFFCVRFYSLG